MTERELLELIASQVGTLTTKVDKIDNRLTELEVDVRFTKETVVKIEHNHGQKLEALFDGYKLTEEKLDRIEQEVTKHEELILKRLK